MKRTPAKRAVAGARPAARQRRDRESPPPARGRAAPPTSAMLERIAEQFRALAEPSRLRLMHILFERPRTVGELAEGAGLSLANASKHLAQLHAAGFVQRRKVSLSVVYALADRRVRALCDLMCRRIEERAAAEVRALGRAD